MRSIVSGEFQLLAIMLFAAISAAAGKEADDPTSSELPNGDLLVGDFEQHDLDQGRVDNDKRPPGGLPTAGRALSGGAAV